MHFIRYDLLYGYVLARLQYWYEQVQQDEERLLKQLLDTSDRERSATKKKHTVELRKSEKRKADQSEQRELQTGFCPVILAKCAQCVIVGIKG